MPGPVDLAPLLLTPLRRISVVGGDVLHGMKASSPGFAGFGEAYFSCVDFQAVKGWKMHTRMTLNLVVIAGEVRFRVFDPVLSEYSTYTLTPNRPDDYNRLTIPPGYWVAFGGIAQETSTLLNLASIEHDPSEAETQPLSGLIWE